MSHAREPKPILRAGLAAAAGLAVLAASACSAPAPPRTVAAASAAPSAGATGPATLPAPTGPHPVGTTALHLKDTSRPDPWVPEAKARELMVTLWYPARARTGQRAPYMTPKESELTLKGRRVTGAPYDLLSKTRTNAFSGAEPAGRKGALPLVVLSPGFTMPRSTLTALAEELAGGGYVVAGIDHTYENHATTFPDGRVAECVACDSDTDPGFGTRVAGVRAADVSFVLDRLTGPDAAWEGSALIDASRIAMAGQSIGGASALAAMVTDSRVRAGINMDGTAYARLPKSGLSRPFLFLGSPGHTPGGRDNSWDRDWKLLTGWKRWLVLPGGDHQSFTDVPLLADALGIEQPGSLPAARSVEITRTYVRAFLDLHLRGERQPLLDGPSPRYPEVEHCAPAAKTCE
ncbi:putative dienelactone hydrolase [Thermocatellispora tengchongensis]|uniref:Putative dienelactone hydrolase n=1 Tax=Thermocatellispora tengchongensis TaxID=1073253 RepID=A0A840P878_9ACTN|nr:alpha/beta hydrolase [Thermocatellispora tengchongensis]MBB5132215.1 putative dienelactone hydrolase [Thermocatellispora tengchongensis]